MLTAKHTNSPLVQLVCLEGPTIEMLYTVASFDDVSVRDVGVLQHSVQKVKRSSFANSKFSINLQSTGLNYIELSLKYT